MGSDEPKRRHVWVDGTGGYRYPGLVITWRRTSDGSGWEAYVAHSHRDGGALLTWELASALHPVADDRYQQTPRPEPRR